MEALDSLWYSGTLEQGQEGHLPPQEQEGQEGQEGHLRQKQHLEHHQHQLHSQRQPHRPPL